MFEESLKLKSSMLKRHLCLFSFYIALNFILMCIGARYLSLKDENQKFLRIFIVIKEVLELTILIGLMYNLRARRWPAYFTLNVPM